MSVSHQERKTAIAKLVRKYEAHRKHYRSSAFNETMLRSEFLDPFFELLGWDIKNTSGSSTHEREVILEESLKSNANTSSKKPDYTFRLYGERVFFLEAKKPSVSIERDSEPAKQVRRYGFSAGLKISVLSNFEYLCIYDTTRVVEPNDSRSYCLIKEYHYSDYESAIDEIYERLGKESVYDGTFNKVWQSIERNVSTVSVDKLFLEQINEWRLLLGNHILTVCPDMDVTELGDIVQSYINKILFLRVCEDRNIEIFQRLLKIAEDGDGNALIAKFQEADNRYNSGLFKQKLSTHVIYNIKSAFWKIIRQLYYPDSPYSFAVLSSDILGRIYEIFVTQRLCYQNGELCIVVKLENKDRNVVTTPNFIVREILRKVIKAADVDNFAENILYKKFADIACGSGSFLLELYQFLCDSLLDYYQKNKKENLIKIGISRYKLPYTTKVRLLLNCIYGVDKDFNAVEACKFGLLLKLLEDENIETIAEQVPILPSLDENILFGNSLLQQNNVSEAHKEEINPFNFGELRFNFIVGNPPYMKTEDMKKYTPLEHRLYPSVYKTAYKQYDKYFLFIERALQLLTEDGVLGYIIPNKFMKVGAAKELRALITQGKKLHQLISLGAHQVFEDKSTYTCIIILTQQQNDYFMYSEVTDFNSWVLRSGSALESSQREISQYNDSTWLLCTDKYRDILNKILIKSRPLGAVLGKSCIFNGIQTSANKVYIFTPTYEDDDFYYFTACNQKEYQVEKSVTKPYFETTHGEGQLSSFCSLKANARVIFPYKKQENGKVDFINITDLQRNYPFLFAYFCDMRERLEGRNIKPDPQTENEWYRYGRQQSLDACEIEEKIIVGVLAQENKYAIDKSSTLVSSGGTAGYCMVYVPYGKPYSIYYIQAILGSRQGEWLASLYGEIFRGGYIARGTKVLQQLPIRVIDFSNTDDVRTHNDIVGRQMKIIEIGDRIELCRGNLRKCIPLERSLEELVETQQKAINKLYGMTDDEVKQIPQISKIYAAN